MKLHPNYQSLCEISLNLTKEPTCEVCGSSSNLKTCSHCKKVHYCGSEHQRSDWGIKHKNDCDPSNKKIKPPSPEKNQGKLNELQEKLKNQAAVSPALSQFSEEDIATATSNIFRQIMWKRLQTFLEQFSDEDPDDPMMQLKILLGGIKVPDIRISESISKSLVIARENGFTEVESVLSLIFELL